METAINSSPFYHYFNYLPIGILILDQKLQVVFWNAVLHDWSGIPYEDIVGKDIRDFFPYFKNPAVAIRILSVLEGGPPVIFSAQLHTQVIHSVSSRGAGMVQHTIVKGVPSAVDQTRWALFTIQDVTEMTAMVQTIRNARDQALREKDTAQKYLDVAGVMLIALDRDLRVTLINKKGREIIGRPEDEIIGKKWLSEFIPKKDQPKIRQLFSRAFSGKYSLREYRESRLITADGGMRDIGWYDILLTDNAGAEIGILSSGEDITEKKQALEQLRLKTNTDHLTGIFSRSYFYDASRVELKYAKRHQKNFLIAILDIDYFKKVNDTYGHQAGDSVLKFFTSRLQANIRDYDILARYGGEEFIILFKDCACAAAHRILNRFLKSLAHHTCPVDHTEITVHCSGGLAELSEFKKKKQATLDSIIQLADKRLYFSKAHGRNRITGCDEESLHHG